MCGIYILLIITWGINGGVGFNALPQAVTDSTSQVAISPYIKLKATRIFPGLQIEGSWRGIFQDTTRHTRSSSRFMTGSLTYKNPALPFSFRIGRQFTYLGIGGLIDGVKGRVNYKKCFFEFLGGKRAPLFYASEEKFFPKDASNVIALQLSPPSFYHLKFKTGYAREFKEDKIVSSPLWVSADFSQRITLKGEVYFDLESKTLSKVSIIHYGAMPYLSWSFGYRYYDLQEIFRLLKLEDQEELSEESKSTHRIEGSLKIKELPLSVSVGGWAYLTKGSTYSTFWIRLSWNLLGFYGWIGKEKDGWQQGGELLTYFNVLPHTAVYLSGRLIDEPRWPNTWVESLRFGIRCKLPLGSTIRGELRLWSNPEVEREVQGYIGAFIPFKWEAGE